MDYKPSGVCSRLIHVELDGDKIANVEFVGECAGSWRIIFCEFHNYRKKGYLSSPYRGRLVAFYGDTFFFMYSYCKISIFIQCFVYLLQLLLF